jgi:hypothetical protein
MRGSSGVRSDREIIDIGECASLDAVIEQLQCLRSRLSEEAQAMVKVDGSDHFGWRLNVTYLRDATAEEVALEARYLPTRQSRQHLANRAAG